MDADRFRPASSAFGSTVGEVVRCRTCGHGSLFAPPADEVLASAYSDAADPVSLREEAGQVATAARDLGAVEAVTGPANGRRLLDVGCWTGSMLVAAGERGWSATGVEPSRWAVARAAERGLDVRRAAIADVAPDAGSFSVVVATDVLEHLLDPGEAVALIAELLEPDGVLFCTVPDAGSRLARALGGRWWAVLPMHVQYFTRGSLGLLLASHGLEICSISTHPKLFTRRYYAERLAAFLPGAPAGGERLAARVPGRDRLTSLDFGDRIAVVARLRPRSEA